MDSLDASGIGIPAQFIADSIRIGGLNRALLPLHSPQHKILKKAYKGAASVLPDLDEAWADWPKILIGYGLGEELGAIPIMIPGFGIPASFNKLNPVPGFWQHDHEPCS